MKFMIHHYLSSDVNVAKTDGGFCIVEPLDALVSAYIMKLQQYKVKLILIK